MSPKPTDIIESARGTIDEEALLTQEGGGVLSTGYLHDQPLVEYLESSESLEYLFHNRKSGLTVVRNGTERSITPDSNYRAMMAVTTRRILFVIGKEDGDKTLNIPLLSVTDATLDPGLINDSLKLSLTDRRLSFKTRSTPDLSDAAKYIIRHDGDGFEEYEENNGCETSDTTTESNIDLNELPEYVEQDSISNTSITSIREAESHIATVGPKIEKIEEAQTRLTKAHNDLCQVLANEDDIDEEQLQNRISEVEQQLDALREAAQLLDEADELSEGSQTDVDEAIATYEAAIDEVAEVGFELPGVVAMISTLEERANGPSPDSEALLEELRELEQKLGAPPNSLHIEAWGEFSVQVYRERFGSVEEAVEQAGMEFKPAILNALRAIAVVTRSRPTRSEFDEYAVYSSSFVFDHFDSWEAACATADVGSEEAVEEFIENLSIAESRALLQVGSTTGELELPDRFVETSPESTKDDESDERTESDEQDLLTQLETAVADLDRVPTYSRMQEYNGLDQQTIAETFGSWSQALAASSVDVRSRLSDELREVGKQLGRAPTKQEVNNQGKYDAHRYEDYFESWEAALSEAGVELPSKQQLIFELEQLEEELGFVPARHHVEQHGRYPPEYYQRRFGSVKQATEAADMDYQEDVLRMISSLSEDLGRQPKVKDFDEHAPYSSSYVYDHFDSWSDACDAAGIEHGEKTKEGPEQRSEQESGEDKHQTEVASEAELVPSPLAEYYEIFGNLQAIQNQLFNDELIDRFDTEEPMVRWHKQCRNLWARDEAEPCPSYGTQQANRSEFSIADYREHYGDGETVTDFSAVETETVPAPIAQLILSVSDRDAQNIVETKIPVAPDSETPLPVVVENESEYEAATALLDEFPEEPAIRADRDPASDPESSGEEGQSEDGQSIPTSEGGSDELTEISGITPAIAESLREAGLRTEEDLRATDTDELADIEGVGTQGARRIKLMVGG